MILGVMLPLLSIAHGYWLEIEGSGKVGEPVTVRVCFGEIDDYNVRRKESDPAEFVLMVFAHGYGCRESLHFEKKVNCWEASFTPKEEGSYRFLAYHKGTQVVEGKKIMPVDYLCSVYQVGPRVEGYNPPTDLNIHVEKEGKLMRVFATNKQQPVPAGTKIRIFNPDNWEKNLTTDDKGTVVFYPERDGLYIIRYDYMEPATGTLEGEPYTTIRHRCNYSYYQGK